MDCGGYIRYRVDPCRVTVETTCIQPAEDPRLWSVLKRIHHDPRPNMTTGSVAFRCKHLVKIGEERIRRFQGSDRLIERILICGITEIHDDIGRRAAQVL